MPSYSVGGPNTNQGQIKLEPCPDWSPLGFNSNLPMSIPAPFPQKAPPPPPVAEKMAAPLSTGFKFKVTFMSVFLNIHVLLWKCSTFFSSFCFSAYMVCCSCDCRRCIHSSQISKESCRLGSVSCLYRDLSYMVSQCYYQVLLDFKSNNRQTNHQRLSGGSELSTFCTLYSWFLPLPCIVVVPASVLFLLQNIMQCNFAISPSPTTYLGDPASCPISSHLP